MSKHFLLLACLACLVSCKGTPADNPADPDENPETPVPAVSPLAGKTSLTAGEAAEYTAFLQQVWKDSVKTALQDSYSKKALTHGSYRMRLLWKIFGEAPSDGRSLYISLHGGGGTASTVNDQQWQNQLRLYEPAEGVYLCPRGITDTWDLHFRPESDGFYEDVIRMAVAFLDVNPDKVYLMGYSAGGDGVWRLAPRMADHWAAASMMAGHPGDVSLVNLRNLPFMIWCGALDAAYDRNKECAARIEEMQQLHEADPEGYVYEGHIVEGKEHWMDLEDAAAVPWMAAFRRNPYPDKVVFRQADEPKTAFYWIGVPASETAKGQEVRARYEGNTVEILSSDYSALTFYLNDTMMDLDSPVKVIFGDKVLFEGAVTRSPAVMRQTLRERGDLSYIYPVRIDVKLP